ncbi:MAG: mechanosensitive ion channel family protein [Candidatus Nezhaarchaeales archaeon]
MKRAMERALQTRLIEHPKLKTTYIFLTRVVLLIIALLGVSTVTFAVFPQLGGLFSSLLITAGFISIVVGLAAQSSLSNLISGLLVSFTQPFRIGDAVMFKGDFCFVEDIRLMYTVLRTWDNRRLIVPNSTLQSEIITNYTVEDPTMLVPVFVQVSYESDLKKAMDIMVDIARKHPDCLPGENIPNVVVMEFQDSGVLLRLLSRAKDQPTAFQMARDLLYQIKLEFDKNGIEIPYPRRYLVVERKLYEQLSRISENLERIARAMQGEANKPSINQHANSDVKPRKVLDDEPRYQ